MSTDNYHKDWEDVIADAESEIALAKDRIAALRASIRLFREHMKAGEPLPEGLERKAGTADTIPA
jgi:hypothetical protein